MRRAMALSLQQQQGFVGDDAFVGGGSGTGTGNDYVPYEDPVDVNDDDDDDDDNDDGGHTSGPGGGESVDEHDHDEDVEEVQEIPEFPVPKVSKSRVIKSDIMSKYFRKLPVQGQPGAYKLHCNYCPKVYAFVKGGGYGTFTKHMKKEHPAEFGISTTQTQLNFQSGTGSTQTSGMGSSSLLKYEHKHAINVWSRYAAVQHMPFNSYDNPHWPKSVRSTYNTCGQKMSRSSIQRATARQCIEMKTELRKYILKLGHRVSICSDVWTDCFLKNSYMGITVHFVDNSWTLNKRLIAFKEFPTPHNAHAIAQLIIHVLNEYRLIGHIFSVGFDNATANTASINELIEACSPVINGKYFHVRCITHILNLCVQDAIALWQEHVDPIRKAVKLIKNNPSTKRAWKKYCHSKQIPYVNFHMDVSHRWNSTHDLLESTKNYKEYLCDFYRSYAQTEFVLLTSCWTQSENLFLLFKAFKTATVELSGVYYCTSVRVLEHCLYVAARFKMSMRSTKDLHLKTVIFYMIQKWLKYFEQIPTVFLIAKVLDPKWKLLGVFKMLDMYYQTLNDLDVAPLRQAGLDTGESFDIDLPSVIEIKYNLENSLRTLFTEYENTYNASHNIQPRSTSTQSSFGYFDPDLAEQLEALYSGTNTSRATSELDLYLESRSIFEDAGPNTQVDVLDWWSTHEKQFPILATMAKEIFAVPASTVAVEQAFSIGGCVLDDRRSNLSAENMEYTMLLEDWEKADMRAQEPDFDVRYESDRDDGTEDEAPATTGSP